MPMRATEMLSPMEWESKATPTYPNAHSTANEVDRFPDDEIYHPPKLAPMPYTGTITKGKSQRRPVPSALASLLHSDPTRLCLEGRPGSGQPRARLEARPRPAALHGV